MRPDNHRPDFSPSYTVHIAPARDPRGGGNYHGMDFWSLQGYTLKRLLAEMLDVNPIRIHLPTSIDTSSRYEFSIVLPVYENQEAMRRRIIQGVEDYFHLVGTRENRSRDVYVLTASDPKLRASAVDPLEGGCFASSLNFLDSSYADSPSLDRPIGIDAVTGFWMEAATVDEFCRMLEGSLDRPIVNETQLAGRFDFRLQYPDDVGRVVPETNFIERLREQLGLVMAARQRDIETMVYKLRWTRIYPQPGLS